MKRIFLYLVIILVTLFCIYNYKKYKTKIVNNGFYKSEIYSSLITKKVNNYLAKKYHLKKDEYNLVEVRDVICEHCRVLLPFCPKEDTYIGYCGKDYIYNIKGKNINVKYKKYIYLRPYKEHFFIFDNYQKDQIISDINLEFKSKLGKKIDSVDISFWPNTTYEPNFFGQKTAIHWITDKDFFVNYYDGNVEKFIQKENLKNINILVGVDVSEYNDVYNDYSNRFEIYAKKYCNDTNNHNHGSSPIFDMYFLEKSKSTEEMRNIVYEYKENGLSNVNRQEFLGGYWYLCGYSKGVSL